MHCGSGVDISVCVRPYCLHHDIGSWRAPTRRVLVTLVGKIKIYVSVARGTICVFIRDFGTLYSPYTCL